MCLRLAEPRISNDEGSTKLAGVGGTSDLGLRDIPRSFVLAVFARERFRMAQKRRELVSTFVAADATGRKVIVQYYRELALQPRCRGPARSVGTDGHDHLGHRRWSRREAKVQGHLRNRVRARRVGAYQ